MMTKLKSMLKKFLYGTTYEHEKTATRVPATKITATRVAVQWQDEARKS
jgi:hypothetical protein